MSARPGGGAAEAARGPLVVQRGSLASARIDASATPNMPAISSGKIVPGSGSCPGPPADDVTLLRRRGHYVVRSETVGEGAGRFVIDNRVVTPDELAARAAQVRARMAA